MSVKARTMLMGLDPVLLYINEDNASRPTIDTNLRGSNTIPRDIMLLVVLNILVNMPLSDGAIDEYVSYTSGGTSISNGLPSSQPLMRFFCGVNASLRDWLYRVSAKAVFSGSISRSSIILDGISLFFDLTISPGS